MATDLPAPTSDIIKALKGLTLSGTTVDDRYQLSVAFLDDILTLKVVGFLLQPIPLEFSNRFEELMTSHQIRRLVIDLSECTYMSSAVMSYLVKYFDITNDIGGTVAVVRPPAKVLHVLKAIGLDTFFTFYPSVAEARAAVTETKAG
jgi:anti-anti-sigma factor